MKRVFSSSSESMTTPNDCIRAHPLIDFATATLASNDAITDYFYDRLREHRDDVRAAYSASDPYFGDTCEHLTPIIMFASLLGTARRLDYAVFCALLTLAKERQYYRIALDSIYAIFESGSKEYAAPAAQLFGYFAHAREFTNDEIPWQSISALPRAAIAPWLWQLDHLAEPFRAWFDMSTFTPPNVTRRSYVRKLVEAASEANVTQILKQLIVAVTAHIFSETAYTLMAVFLHDPELVLQHRTDKHTTRVAITHKLACVTPSDISEREHRIVVAAEFAHCGMLFGDHELDQLALCYVCHATAYAHGYNTTSVRTFELLCESCARTLARPSAVIREQFGKMRYPGLKAKLA